MASVARKDAKRFSSLNLGTTYKGAKPEAKGAGNKGGFQSLGKIQGKRMPGPAQLPSLRKENAGNDPNVNLVPQAGGGWGMGKEDEAENKELPNQLPVSQPVTQSQDVQTATQQSTGGRETGVKKEGIWATPEANSVGPANVPPNQHFKKNFPSLEEREARGTKRTITNELHHDSVPFNEMDNMSNVPPPPAMPPGHYHFAPRPRPPYAAAPSHMGPPYIPRGMPAFRHGMPPPPAEYNHYSHHGGAYRGYPPQQQPGPPPNSAAGGQYQYPVPRYHLPPNSSLPHNMDPYQDGQAKLVKSEELKNLELPDEDDDVGGWAGYHEEVDYSKKVVFNDSSDDEERENHQEHQQRQLKRKEMHERESTSREMRMQEAPPLAAVEQPHLHADQPNKHLHTATADLQYFQQHSQSGGSHYPLYYTAHPPQRAYPITVASRPVEKERPHQVPQSDLQPIWQQNRRPKGVPPPESAWGDDKLVTSPAVTQSSTVQSIANEQLESIQQQLEQTTLNDNDSNVTALSAEKKHVTFHLEQQQPAAPPAARQPLKIMMRDMKLSARDENDQTSTTENFHHGNMVKTPYHHRPNDTDHQHAVNIDRSLQQQQKISAWKAADRGPITTPRTLYEPEGDKSAKKFNALIKQTSSERGKRGSVSDSTQDGEQVQSPSGDIKILKAEEKQSKGKLTATTPTDEVTTVHSKPQQTSHKNKTAESSSTTAKKGSKRERPSFRQYQPPAAREQDEQSYPESKGSGRRSSRQDYNYEQQGDSRSQRRRDRPPSEGKYHSDKRYSSDSSKHQTEGKPQPDGKTQSESKHHPEGKRQVDSSNRRENKSRKEREASKEPPASTHEQTEQHTAIAADVSKEDVSKSEHSQDDKTKQSAKDSHSKGGGDTKHRKKNTTASGPATQKSDGSISREKSRGRGRGRGSNNDDWYYSDEYYNHWYASGGYDSYYYYYDDYNYYSDRRAPSGRQKQQQQQQQSYDGSKNTSERRDTGGKKYQQQQQQQTDRGNNRPARTRGGDRKDEASEDKPHQHRATKDKSREVSGEEVSRSKAAEEADIRDRGRRRDSKPQHQESNIDKKRSSRTAGSKATAPHSTTSSSKSSASHDPTTRGQSRASSNKASVSQDRPQQSDTQQHSTASENSSGKKEPAIKDKAASAKMANVDINSPTVFVIDEEQTIPLPSTSSENDDFIRVTSKKEKREMKEQEKHRQQEKQRKAEEEENKKKQHSTRKSSQKTKYQQQQHQLQEQSLPHEDQSLSSTWSTTTTTTVSSASIWSESITSLLNEGVSQTSYMAAAHSSLMAPGDYQLFPTSSYSSSSAPLAHLSAAVDSSVAQDLPTSAAQGHSLSETDVKPAGVGRPDTSSAGHGAIRTDLPLSKSHSSASVGGAIGRGRGSSSSRAPGSNRGSSSRDSSKKLPASSSDSKLTSSTSPKISKPSSAVRSKPSATANTVSSSDKVTSSAATATMTATTSRRKMATDVLLTRPAQDASGSSKRAGSQSATGTKSSKLNQSKSPSAKRQQPHPQPAISSPSSNVSTVSYANAVKSSPSLQDKKSPAANKPVAYVKPTASNATTATAPSLSDQQEDIVSTTIEPLSRMPSFPTAQLSQELIPDEPVIVTGTDDQQMKVTSKPTVVVAPPPAPAFVPPVVSKSSSPVTTATVAAVSKSSRLSFTPFTFVASPSTTGVTNHQASIVQVTTVTSTVTSHPAQPSDGDNGKEAVSEVEEMASKRIRLGPSVQRSTHINDHSTKLNIAAVPFIPSCVSIPVTSHQKSVSITAATTTANVTTPTVAPTPFCKASMPATCYQLPTATMMPANMVPFIMPHPQMGSGYTLSQQTPYPFHTAVPSHAYPMQAHPPSIVGLAYAGYPMQQAAMVPSAVTNSGLPPAGVPNAAAPTYNVYVPQPVSGSNVIPAAPPFPPAAAAHARMEQRKKEEQMKALSDTKRFFEQNAVSSSVAKQQQPPLYKYPLSVKQQLPMTTEGGRRTLLENPRVPMAMAHPPVAQMMSRPVEMTINSSPSTGSKRKRRPPLLQQLPVTNNVTMTTPWDKTTNTTMY